MFGGELLPPAQFQLLKGHPMMFPRDPDHALHAALSVLAAARTETRPAEIEDERVLPDAALLQWFSAGPLGVDPADLADLPLFAGIAPADLSGLAGRLGRVALAPGHTLMSAEQPG